MASVDEDTRLTRDPEKQLLKPNVIKIQILDGPKVLRYLGTLERIGYKNVRQQVMQNQVPAANGDLTGTPLDGVFYGILKAGIDQSWGVGASWQAQNGSGGLLGHIKAIVNKIPVVGPGMEIIDGIAKLGERLTGTNTTATGSASMKNYGGATLTAASATVAWYLPEQYGMCQKGLRTLLRMAYPKPVNEEQFEASISNIATQAGAAIKEKLDSVASGAASLLGIGGAPAGGDPPVETPAPKPDPNGSLKDTSLIGSALELGIKGGFALNALFGRNLTFDPIPVRLFIGQYIDIEPLVITGVKIKFSRELFISNRIGAGGAPLHVPIFCEAEITFDYWLNPGPQMQFMKLLGSEIFGDVVDPTIDVTL